jgi:23S rRNA pseudouridine2605 synthase
MTLKKTSKKKILVRIQKIIADSGLCSRRNAEDLITAGRVKLNGEYAEIGQSANPKTDEILVDDKPLQIQKKRYVVMHKPFGYHTTTEDPFAIKKVTDLLDKAGVEERLYPVGRLDKNASGLLLLTNDGDWGNKIIHPSIGFEKEYHVKTSKAMNKSQINEIRAGIMLKDGPVQAKIKALSRGFYSVTLKAGRHKIVKRIFKYFDVHVSQLKRVRIGPYKLGTLKEGDIQEINKEIVEMTKKTLKKDLLKKPTRILTKKDRYEHRTPVVRRGKEKKSLRKDSPKIDKAFTKRKRDEIRNPGSTKRVRTSNRESFDEDKPTPKRFERKKTEIRNSKPPSRRTRPSDKDNKTRDSRKYSKTSEKKPSFKKGKERESRSKNSEKKPFKKSTVSKKPRKFTASSDKRMKAKPFSMDDFDSKKTSKKTESDSPRRLHSIAASKPFNKEKTSRKVGKKRDPLKPKKGAKKRWK